MPVNEGRSHERALEGPIVLNAVSGNVRAIRAARLGINLVGISGSLTAIGTGSVDLYRAHVAKNAIFIGNGSDEVLARAVNLLIGRAAFETAKRMYPGDLIEYRHGAQVIERSGNGED